MLFSNVSTYLHPIKVNLELSCIIESPSIKILGVLGGQWFYSICIV
jgi:hypothetical protein